MGTASIKNRVGSFTVGEVPPLVRPLHDFPNESNGGFGGTEEEKMNFQQFHELMRF